jgi:photosystem II stability/assembly factor-like uncharacterized protein
MSTAFGLCARHRSQYAQVVMHRHSALKVAFVVVLAGSILLSSPRAFGASTSGSAHDVQHGTPLTNTTFGSFSQLDQIDMLSPSLGYALASRTVGKSRYRYFLVRTTDLARTWTVVSEIPGDVERYPIFTDFDTYDSDPALFFVNRNIGYVDGRGGSIDVTDNGGLTWRSITTRDSSSSYSVSGSTTSVVSATCTTRSSQIWANCRSVLREFANGSSTPESSRPIPTSGVEYAQDVGLLAAVSNSTEIVDLSNDVLSTTSSLLITHDDGLTWTTLENPCSSSMILQLVVANNGQWLLSCFHDYGMYHGTAQIFRSTDQGLEWSTVVDDTYDRNVVGNLGGTPVYLFFNGDDRILYAVMMNPAGGLLSSTDGGTTWTTDRIFGNTGGSPGSVTNFGATSSIYQVFQGPVYVTRNSRTWRLAPQLPAGAYKGMSICTAHGTKVSMRHATSGGLSYSYADFTNTSTSPCYLNEAPNVQPVNAKDKNVGPPITTEISNPNGGFVVLKANGGIANVSVNFNPTSTYHPSSTCDPAVVSALRINFGPPSSFHLRLASRPGSVCRASPSLFVTSVRVGRGKP